MSWDEYAEGWDEDEAVRTYSNAAFECLTRLCEERSFPLQGTRALDFGCGTGLLTEKLAPICSTVVALDTSAAMIEQLDQKIARLGLENVQTTTEDLKPARQTNATLATASFDLIVCSSVCAFVDDYPATLATLASLLKPGGLFVQWDWELNPDDEEPYGLTREQIRAALTGSGLDEILVETAFEVPMGEMVMRPLMGAGWALGRN